MAKGFKDRDDNTQGDIYRLEGRGKLVERSVFEGVGDRKR